MSGRSLEDIQDEILDALHGGEPIDRAAILARNPEHADALRRFFDLVAVIETPAEPKPAQPSRLGEFEIIRELGRGGMGVVYEARQVSLNRRVALKVLPPAMRSDRRLLTRFQREAEAAARLRHPNIVPVYSIGESAGAPFFAMELVEGRSLAEIIKLRKAGDDAGLPKAGVEYRRWAVSTVARIADALDYAHGRGILHRDVKPGNILIEADGTPRLTDFGLALDLQASELTQTGEMFGSPLYMSPEQAFRREAPVDARTDIYSLAVTLYELLTLRLPYHGTTHAELMSALSSGKIVAPRLADPDCPEPLERVLVQALRSDPHDRYATAGTFAVDLRAALERPQDVRALAGRPASRAATSTDRADGRGLDADADKSRWARMMGFFLIAAGLSLLLFGHGPAPDIAWIFFLGGIALWAWESWSLSRSPRGAGEPLPDQPMRGLVARTAQGRWGPGLAGVLLFVGLLIHMNDGPVLLVVAFLVLGFLVLKRSGLFTGLRSKPAESAPAPIATADGAPPENTSRWKQWRRERPIFSGWAFGCGCLVFAFLGFALIAALFGIGRAHRRSGETAVHVTSSGVRVKAGPAGATTTVEIGELGLLESFRTLSVPFDLSFFSVLPQRPLSGPNDQRHADYPAPHWAPLLGNRMSGDSPDQLDFETVDGEDPQTSDEPGVEVSGPLVGHFASRGTQMVLCPEGIDGQGSLTADGYCTLLVGQDLAGRCLLNSYSTAIVNGALTGSIEAYSYVNVLITGDLNGRFVGQNRSLLYILGRMTGSIEFTTEGKVYIAGRTDRADLERITGKATVLLLDSDLGPGEHQIGQLTVTVRP